MVGATIRRATLALVVAAACAHAPRREVVEPVARLDCDAAGRVLAEHPARPPPADGLRRVVTTPLSWLTIGAGYTADVVALALIGFVGGALVCTPVWAVEAALGGSGDVGGECIGGVSEAFWDQGELLGIGAGAARVTRAWRCQELRRGWAETLSVARCLADRSGPGDLARATSMLEPLQAPEAQRCLPMNRLTELDLLEQRLKDLHRGSPPEAWEVDELGPVLGPQPAEPPPQVD